MMTEGWMKVLTDIEQQLTGNIFTSKAILLDQLKRTSVARDSSRQTQPTRGKMTTR